APMRPLRQEGLTEQVSDVQFTCTGTAGGPATIQVSLNANVTSKLLNSTTGATEALALTSGGAVQGIVSGQTVTFAGVQIPSGISTVTLTNIRVDASPIAGTPVFESVVVSGSGVVPASIGFVQVGVSNSTPLAGSI